MISLGSRTGKIKCYVAILFAIAAGVLRPISFTFIGKLFDNGAMDPDNYDNMIDYTDYIQTSMVTNINKMVLFAGISWICAWIYVTLMTQFAEEVTLRTRRKYLESVLG